MVAAIAIGATVAYFSDTAQVTNNTFTAGTIDININGENPFVDSFNIGDLKPGETGYINFRINNVGTNPVDVSKKLYDFTKHDSGEGYACGAPINGNVSSEPECVAEIAFGSRKDDVETQIIYDLSVEVYNNLDQKIWWQAIYEDTEGKHIGEIYDGSNYVDLGMIPVGGYMLVTQSYHFDPLADNKYQGDGLIFNMEIKGEQLTGENGYASVALENKTGPTEWDIIQDGISGTLSYKTQGPLFVYNFSGVAPLFNHSYVLAVGYNASTDVDTQIGTGITDGTGNITFSGSFNTGNLTNAKAWLVPAENWSGGMVWTGWPASASNFLWETALINYTKN